MTTTTTKAAVAKSVVEHLCETHRNLLEFAAMGEAGLAKHGAKVLDKKVIYCKGDGYAWNERTLLWSQMKEMEMSEFMFDETRTLLLDVIDKINFLPEPFPYDKDAVLRTLSTAVKKVNGTSSMNGIWSRVKGTLKSVNSLNNYSDQLPLKGGKKINLRTLEITDRTSEDKWSYEIQASGIQCSDQARADNLAFYGNFCKTQGVVDPDLLDYLQVLSGYWMTYEVCDKAFYILVGPSDSGKSYMVKNMQNILTENRISPCSRDIFVKPVSEGNHQTYFGALEGKSMVYVQELDESKSLNATIVKSGTGDDDIKFRMCYAKDETILTVTCKFVIGTNEMVKMNGGDSGLVKRLRKIPFNHSGYEHASVAERTANQAMLARLKTQDGINATFAWWAEGARRVLNNIDNGNCRIEPPQTVVDEGQSFMRDSDSFSHFLEECCEICPEGLYERNRLQADYRIFCDDFSYTGNQKLMKSSLVDKIRAKFPGQKARGDWIGFKPKVRMMM